MWGIEVCCDGELQRTVYVSANDTTACLKAHACSAMGLDPEKCELWDYYSNKKYRRLDGEQLITHTLAQAGLLDGQSVLLTTKVPTTKKNWCCKLKLPWRCKHQSTHTNKNSVHRNASKHKETIPASSIQQQHAEQQLEQALQHYISQPQPQQIDAEVSRKLHRPLGSLAEVQGLGLTVLLAVALLLHCERKVAGVVAAAPQIKASADCTGSSSSSTGGGCRQDDNAPAGCSPQCIVCMDSPRSVLLLPCKHLCLCRQCVLKMQKQQPSQQQQEEQLQGFECPVCREGVVDVVAGVLMA